MNKEEIDYGIAIEDLQRPDGLRELAKIQLNRMIENSREQYIKSLQQENKQLKDNWNKLKDDLKHWIHNVRGTDTANKLKYILDKMQELEKGDSNE